MNKYATGVGGGVLDAPLALVNPKGRGVETPPPTYTSHNYSLKCLTRQPRIDVKIDTISKSLESIALWAFCVDKCLTLGQV